MKTRLYLTAAAILLLAAPLFAFTGNITYAVHERQLDEASFRVRDYSVKYFVDKGKAAFDRETALGDAHCVFEGQQLRLDLDLFGESRLVEVQPDYFFAFQEGQRVVDYVENGETMLFRGKECVGYDLFFDGETQFVGKAFTLTDLQNTSFDLPLLPNMPVYFEVLDGFEVLSYRAIGLEEEKWPAYLTNSNKGKKVTSFCSLEDDFSQILFKNPHLRKQFDMDILIKGKVTQAKSKREKVLSAMQVRVFAGTRLITTTKTDLQGRYKLKLPLGSNYRIEFGDDSQVKKVVEYQTSDIPYIEQIGGFESKLDIGLFVPKEGVDYSIADEAIARAIYQDETRNFDFDMDFTEQQIKRFEQAAGHAWN